MKSFTERNPFVIGVIVIALIAATTTGALALNGGLFKSRYVVKARFADTAGLRNGDKVRVAGVNAGQVGSIRQHLDQVDVELKLDKSVELPKDVRAEIVVETLLGSKYVRLVGGTEWSHLLRDGDLITDTQTPTEVLDVENVGTPLLEKTDAKAINDLLGKLDRVTAGQRGNVGEIIVGLNRLLTAVNQRQTEARRLISSSRTVTGTLSERDGDLLAAVDDLNVVLDGLAKRRVQLVSLLNRTESAARKTADLVATNRPQLDAVLDEIHQDLIIVEKNQDDLAVSLADMTNAISGFASIGYSGPDEYPNTWANMYTQLIGPLSPDALFGSCGLLDDAFDTLIGPDPIANCDARTGPLPSASSSSKSGGSTSGGSKSGSTSGGSTQTDPLAIVYGPMTGGGG